MGTKNVLYKKQLLRKKMYSAIFYGILFLLTTIIYYFVNISHAKDVLEFMVHVKDANALVEDASYELKITETEGKYYAKLAPNQGGREIEKYIILTEEEYNKLQETNQENNIEEETQSENESSDVENENPEEATDEAKNEITDETNVTENADDTENGEVQEEKTTQEGTIADVDTEQKTEKEEKNKNEYLPDEEIELTQEQIVSGNIYVLAVYKSAEDTTEISDNVVAAKEAEELDGLIKAELMEKEQLRAPEPVRAAGNALVIDDYYSDYYYYRGKSFTDDLSGVDRSTYTDANLIQVTINYHGYAPQDENNDAMIGKISLDTNERQDTIQHIRCLPVSNGRVSIELMDNPFMDKPTGYGFSGWTSPDGTITTNSNTKVQTLSVLATSNITVDVYAYWQTATVIYLNGTGGNDNRDGLTAANAVRSWTTAVSKLSSSNDRERNIIVLCGNMTDGINYEGGSSGTTNSNYSSASNSKALTITSLYGHTDYRSQATLTLTNSTRGTFTIYKDFQMNHVRIAGSAGYKTGTNNGAGISTSYPCLFGRNNNVRIGRGITLTTTTDTTCVFNCVAGGNNSTSTTSSTAAYKCVVESGKYYSIIGTNYYNGNSGSYAGTTYLTLGSDVDRAEGHIDNTSLSVYFRSTVNSGSGYNGTSGNDMAFLIDVKSGKFGIDYYNDNGDSSSTSSYTTGIYVGGYGTGVSTGQTGTTDRSHRCIIVEGGNIFNIIGGIKLSTTFSSSVKTKIYVKNGTVNNIVGGAGQSTTYGDRMIQVTGGNVVYSISGGSNGAYGGSGDGKITSCNTLVYVGGDAKIGTSATIGATLYGVHGGCVLGAGNGAQGVDGCGQVDNSHIVINDSAHILNSVYGGGNYGVVGASGTGATAVIDILGGTIDGSVYGGSNQNNINGSTTINMSAGQVVTAIYGGSNSSGTVRSTATINIKGGTLGTSGNTNPVLCGGGKGSNTVVTGNATVNITDDVGSVNIYGSVYGGSEQGAVGTVTKTVTYSRVTTIEDGETYFIANGTATTSYALIINNNGLTRGQLSGSAVPADNYQWKFTGTGPYTIQNVGTGQYLGGNGNNLAILTSAYNWTYNTNNQLRSSANNRYLRYSNSTWSLSNTSYSVYLLKPNVTVNYTGTPANTTVNIADDLTTSNKSISIVGNVFAGGKGTEGNEAVVTGNSTVTVDGLNCPQVNIFGGNDINGLTNGNIRVNIGEHYSSTVANVYGGGNEDDTGTEADSVRVYLYSNAHVTDAFNGGKSADLLATSSTDTSREIRLQGGSASRIFGGSDSSGTVTVSNVYIESGTVTNVYGGNNIGGNTITSHVYVTGGTVNEDVYGGGYQAATTTSNVSLTGGSIRDGFGGGHSAGVTTTNISLGSSSTTGTSARDIYGGSNQLGTVGTSNVNIISGTVRDVFGGNNAGGSTGDTNVIVTSDVNRNVYGGGNSAATTGDTYLNIKNAEIGDSAFGGGKGSQAVVQGDSTTIIEGTTEIHGDLFGGGDAAANGQVNLNNSLVKTYITGGTIGGDVYGAANTSVVNGDTEVKIGTVAVNMSGLQQGTVDIGGTVFGGGKSNLAGSASYDFNFESVTQDANIVINAQGYDNGTYTFTIGESVFGSGNAAKISGDGYVTIANYGTSSNIKENVSIQRATQVVLDNCAIYLEGTSDSTNEIATAIYTFNRVDDLVLKNDTILYLASGVNITSKLESLDSSGQKAAVSIGANGVTSRTANNRIFLSQGKNIILKTELGTDGEVVGMTYVGLFKGGRARNTGFYAESFADGATLTQEQQEFFARNSYVQGKHYVSHDITVDGFYTHFDENGTMNIDYIDPIPEDANYYQWIVGHITSDIYYEEIELIATKYATTATYVLPLNGLSEPNTTIEVKEFNISDLISGVTFGNPNDIPRIAPTAQAADSQFGLTMTAGNVRMAGKRFN